MSTENVQGPEVIKVPILEKINKALADLGSDSKWRRAPEFMAEYLPLKDKVVVMIDDIKEILENFVPHLMVATEGKSSFIEYKGQKLDELVQQIMKYHPDIVVVDFHLSDYVKGSSVVRALKEKNFAGEMVGFSSDSHVAREFTNAGAKGAVEKNNAYPERSVGELAKIVSR